MLELEIGLNPASIRKFWNQTRRKQLKYYGMYYTKDGDQVMYWSLPSYSS